MPLLLEKMRPILWLAVAMLMLGYSGCSDDDTTDPAGTAQSSATPPAAGASPPAASEVLPTGLNGPFDVADLSLDSGLISSFGLIRSARDSGIGHGGIDFPTVADTPFYAVADGIIEQISDSSKSGKDLHLRIGATQTGTVGWLFIYESVVLEPGIQVGTIVTRGQLIARNLNPAVPNNHVQLTYSETFGWINHTCWPNQLDAAGQNALQSKFDALKQTTQFLNQWNTANEEGFYP